MTSPSPRSTSTLAIVSLVSGILSWILIPILGSLVAIITGHMARRETSGAAPSADGDGLAITGLILGYLQLVLVFLGIALVIVFFGGIAALATLGAH